jgi:hypothetical protein
LTAPLDPFYAETFSCMKGKCGIGPRGEEQGAGRRRGSRWRFFRALAVAAAFGLGGCAVDTMGALASQITPAGSAVVIDLYTVGAHLRTRAEDRGLTIGLARRSYIFAVEDAGNVSPGWHLLWTPLPTGAAVAQHVASLGLEARAGPVDYGLTLGLRVATVIARVPRDTDMALTLDYTPSHPERTLLQVCRESERCAMDVFFSY